MAKKKQVAFLLEKDQKEIIDELSNEEAGIIFKAIYEYELNKTEPKLDRTLRIVFKQIRIKLDAYNKAYEEKCLKNKENIENYWKNIKDTNEYERIRTNTMATNKIKINKNKINKIKENKNKLNNISNNISILSNKQKKKKEIIKEGEKEKEKEREMKGVAVADSPTLDFVISYGASLGVGKEYCVKFYNHYEAIGWVNGTGQPIKNWKLIFQNWISKDQGKKEKETKKVDEGVFKL